MTDAAAEPTEPAARGSKGPLILGLVLALAGAGGGFFAVRTGLVLPTGEDHAESPAAPAPHVPIATDIAFVQIPTMVVSYNDRGRRQVLRFTAELEVGKAARPDVETLVPRIVDVLNGYLRALELSDIEDPLALVRLRAQMLRRIQIVTGRDMVRDILIMEFVLT